MKKKTKNLFLKNHCFFSEKFQRHKTIGNSCRTFSNFQVFQLNRFLAGFKEQKNVCVCVCVCERGRERERKKKDTDLTNCLSVEENSKSIVTDHSSKL